MHAGILNLWERSTSIGIRYALEIENALGFCVQLRQSEKVTVYGSVNLQTEALWALHHSYPGIRMVPSHTICRN